MRRCRLCDATLTRSFLDLGVTPLANAFVAPEDLHRAEPHYPLHAFVCDACLLVQLDAVATPERIFSDYAYFSSYSTSWLANAERYSGEMIERFALDQRSLVVEVASNDGYLLRNFVAAGIPALGVEPAANVADAARAAGVETVVEFFGRECAERLRRERGPADLMTANNVLAHVPDLGDFIDGFRQLLAPEGVATFEFPHLANLIAETQFDTIYHEHFSYFSLLAAREAFRRHGLRVFDVERLPSHGGSLRLFVAHDASTHAQRPSVDAVIERERADGLDRLDTYAAFSERVREVKYGLLEFLIGAQRGGKTVAAYGAAAKGNTLLVFCGVDRGLVDYVVDLSPHKQGRYLPGTHLPVHAPSEIAKTRPDYVLILPWNLRDEIAAEMAHIREWGGRFVTAIPRVDVF